MLRIIDTLVFQMFIMVSGMHKEEKIICYEEEITKSSKLDAC